MNGPKIDNDYNKQKSIKSFTGTISIFLQCTKSLGLSRQGTPTQDTNIN